MGNIAAIWQIDDQDAGEMAEASPSVGCRADMGGPGPPQGFVCHGRCLVVEMLMSQSSSQAYSLLVAWDEVSTVAARTFQ